LNDDKNKKSPTEVKIFENIDIKKIVCGSNHTIVLTGNPFILKIK
jgi:alpha-tubulin suppressor-like RCC1 family protein